MSSNSSHQTIKNFLQQFQQTDTALPSSINLSRSSFRRSPLCNLVETSSNERKIFNYGNRGIKFNRWPVLSSFRETFTESRNLLIGPRHQQRRDVRRETKDWNKEDEKNRIKSLLCRILLLSCLVIIFHLVSSCRFVSFQRFSQRCLTGRNVRNELSILVFSRLSIIIPRTVAFPSSLVRSATGMLPFPASYRRYSFRILPLFPYYVVLVRNCNPVDASSP